MGIRLGIDTGGTFTDLVSADEETNVIITYKIPSTLDEPVLALKRVILESGVPIPSINSILIGSTVAINAVLTRNGAKVLLITTKGIRDSLFIQRINRKYHYRLDWKKPEPLVKRRNIVEVDERIDHTGEVLIPLTIEELDSLHEKIEIIMKRETVSSFAVSTLFSYLNPTHEKKIGAYLHTAYPDMSISLSHQISPIWKEFERTNTVVTNAYISPKVKKYVSGANSAFTQLGLSCIKSMVKSNGAIEILDKVPDRPLNVLLSGLAGGINAGKYFGEITGHSNCITLDMGGTSCDIGLVPDGKVRYTTEFEIEWGLPITTTAVDITTIGAGGGSIGWRDKGGFLRVGPMSAGAEPGPACYDKGGDDPTISDANLVLGRLNPDYFLKGQMALNLPKAEESIGRLAEQLEMSIHEAAVSLIRIANENMAGQIKLLTVEKGLDPRTYSIVAFGGAGPLHGAAIAESLKIKKVIIPINPGICSAFGSLISDMRVDKVVTSAMRSDALIAEDLKRIFFEMIDAAKKELEEEGFHGSPSLSLLISMRYLEQNYERDVSVLLDDIVNGESVSVLLNRFHENYENFYGYSFPENIVELIHFKVSAYGSVPFTGIEEIGRQGIPEPKSIRSVTLDSGEEVSCNVFERSGLGAETKLKGPLIIEEPASTTFIRKNDEIRVDSYGNIIISIEDGAHEH